jgi:hypothetical protein
VFKLYCTKKLLDRIKPTVEGAGQSTTVMGDWYATAWFWKPQLALLVNERTLLPVVMPLAPTASLAERFPEALAQVLLALDVEQHFVKSEFERMGKVTYCKTVNRSVVGIMNQFTYHAEGYRDHFDMEDPLALSLKLAGTPCSPLYKDAVCPDLAVKQLVASGVVQ